MRGEGPPNVAALLFEGGEPVCWKLMPGLALKALNSVRLCASHLAEMRKPNGEDDPPNAVEDEDDDEEAAPPGGLGNGTKGLYELVALLVCRYLSLRRDPATRLMLGLADARSGAVAQTWML